MLNILNRLWMKSNDGASSINWKRSRVPRTFVRILRVLFISGRTSSRVSLLLGLIVSFLLFLLILGFFAMLYFQLDLGLDLPFFLLAFDFFYGNYELLYSLSVIAPVKIYSNPLEQKYENFSRKQR